MSQTEAIAHKKKKKYFAIVSSGNKKKIVCEFKNKEAPWQGHHVECRKKNS